MTASRRPVTVLISVTELPPAFATHNCVPDSARAYGLENPYPADRNRSGCPFSAFISVTELAGTLATQTCSPEVATAFGPRKANAAELSVRRCAPLAADSSVTELPRTLVIHSRPPLAAAAPGAGPGRQPGADGGHDGGPRADHDDGGDDARRLFRGPAVRGRRVPS